MGHKTLRKTVGARELKTRLGQYIREVRAGVTIVVTERGEAVAELRPLAKARGIEANMSAMAETGALTRASSERLPPFRAVKVAGAPVSRTIADDREDRI